MLYLGNASSQNVRNAMTAGRIGMLATPGEGRSPAGYRYWAADNSRYGKAWPGYETWLRWLHRMLPWRATCLWAAAPDVVGDAVATLAWSRPWLPVIRSLGYRAALVAQDGLERIPIPWSSFDVLFLGGSTDWKLSRPAAAVAAEAKRRGKQVHMGRVNSARRWRYAEHIGCDTCDGTFLAFGPDTNLRRLGNWIDQPALFGGAA